MLVDFLDGLMERLRRTRGERRRRVLERAGMQIAPDVHLPASTSIDASHCYLISVEAGCTLGEECFLLAHDAQMDEFLDAGRLGRIAIREGSHLGHRTMVLPGVEIGPRTIVLPNSVVTKDLPPDTVCSGLPAKVVATRDEYVQRWRAEQAELPTLTGAALAARAANERGRRQLCQELSRGGYVRD